MLSILIPTYNYNIVPLVEELHKQCLECSIEFEILVYDDGSKSEINSINSTINNIQNCTFKELPNNIGRSAIRNLLGKNARHENLIFLDADVIPSSKTFIKDYLDIIIKPVSIGGVIPTKKIPNKPKRLRWIYTEKREQKAFCSSNFIIKKNILDKFPFDESIKKYGYEDVLFFTTLQKNDCLIYSFENPVIHIVNDDANTFIKKTEDAIENLSYLVQQGKLTKEESKVFKYYLYIEKLNLVKLATLVFNVLKKSIVLNLNSNNSSLLLYDIYRIGYLCQLKTKK
jgi:Glycosyl transferase family 2